MFGGSSRFLLPVHFLFLLWSHRSSWPSGMKKYKIILRFKGWVCRLLEESGMVDRLVDLFSRVLLILELFLSFPESTEL